MTNKQFYKRLAQEIDENVLPQHKHIIKDMKITSLEQALGIFRAIMIRNRSQHEEIHHMEKELKKLMDVVGMQPEDE